MSLIVMLWQKRALDPPLTLTELPDVHYLALEQRNSLLVWILPFFFSQNRGRFLGMQEIPTALALALSQPWGTLPQLTTPFLGPDSPPPSPFLVSSLQSVSSLSLSTLSPTFPPSPALSHTHPLFIFLPPSGPC